VAVAASEPRLLMAESAALWMEEAAEVMAEPASLVRDAAPEVISEPMELAMEAMSEGAPPTAEVSWEMRESTWALATPAAMTAVAMVEKRILMVWVGGLYGWVDGKELSVVGLMWRVFELWMGVEGRAR
jgi:hypothetical protein